MNFFQPDSIYSRQAAENESVSKVAYYTILGQEDYLENDLPLKTEEDDLVYAKKTLRVNNSIKYSVRLATDGKLLNPFSVYDDNKINNQTFLESVCRANHKFKTVNETTFNWYVKFLSTKNIAWLKNAEREME